MILKVNKIKDQIHTFQLLIDISFFLCSYLYLLIKYADIFEFLIFDIFHFI